MNVILRRVGSFAQHAEILLSRFPVILGRSSSADVLVAGGTVSRAHCILELEGGKLIVRDCSSSNGTWVNGVPVVEQVLSSGDLLSLGNVTFLVSYHPSWAERLLRLVPWPLRRSLSRVEARAGQAGSPFCREPSTERTQGLTPPGMQVVPSLHEKDRRVPDPGLETSATDSCGER